MNKVACRRTRTSKRNYSKPAQLFKVLSDPHRLRILATIATSDEEVCVCDLTSDLPLLQPTVSHHLRVLKESGLVVSERRATWVYYRLAPGAHALIENAVRVLFGGKVAAQQALRKTG